MVPWQAPSTSPLFQFDPSCSGFFSSCAVCVSLFSCVLVWPSNRSIWLPPRCMFACRCFWDGVGVRLAVDTTLVSPLHCRRVSASRSTIHRWGCPQCSKTKKGEGVPRVCGCSFGCQKTRCFISQLAKAKSRGAVRFTQETGTSLAVQVGRNAVLCGSKGVCFIILGASHRDGFTGRNLFVPRSGRTFKVGALSWKRVFDFIDFFVKTFWKVDYLQMITIEVFIRKASMIWIRICMSMRTHQILRQIGLCSSRLFNSDAHTRFPHNDTSTRQRIRPTTTHSLSLDRVSIRDRMWKGDSSVHVQRIWNVNRIQGSPSHEFTTFRRDSRIVREISQGTTRLKAS